MHTSDPNKNGKVKEEEEEIELSLKRISSTFSRSTRGKRIEILDDETKKRDDEFWRNNPLFKCS